MEKKELRNRLTASLAQMYDIEAIGSLAEFLQGELHVMQYLSDHKGQEINPSILSAQLHVSRPRITAALSALRKKGYVTMEMSDHDRRRMRVMLTDSAEALVRSKHKNVEGYFDILVDGLGEDNVLQLIRLIDLSVETMNKKLMK
ncbi:MAG: MarR family winged helix-turn-helix transcriptional regulator [Saccharofermentanales bacterium]